MKTFKEYREEIDLEMEKLYPQENGFNRDWGPSRTTLEVSNEILVMAMNDFIKDLQELRNEK